MEKSVMWLCRGSLLCCSHSHVRKHLKVSKNFPFLLLFFFLSPRWFRTRGTRFASVFWCKRVVCVHSNAIKTGFVISYWRNFWRFFLFFIHFSWNSLCPLPLSNWRLFRSLCFTFPFSCPSISHPIKSLLSLLKSVFFWWCLWMLNSVWLFL